jgi:hypothetical protein
MEVEIADYSKVGDVKDTWTLSKSCISAESLLVVKQALSTSQPIELTLVGPTGFCWTCLSEVRVTDLNFVFKKLSTPVHSDRKREARNAAQAANLKPYDRICISDNLPAVVVNVMPEGIAEVVYCSNGEHIAEDVKFDGKKFVFVIKGPNGAYADNHSRFAPFIHALKNPKY